MVALAKATTKPALTAKQREAKRARNAYIKSATILIEGCRARVASQHDGNKRYDVLIGDGKATSCTCPDRQYRKAYCKHMEATDLRLALPQLPAGAAKLRKVRGQAKLIAVPVAPKVVPKEEPTKTETPKTERRTAKLTQQTAKPSTVVIIDRSDIEAGGVALDVTDDLGNACRVTLRRTKQHSCTCGAIRCIHIEHCAGVENARYYAAKAEQAKIVEAKPAISEEERRERAVLNGNRGFSLMRRQ